MKNLVQATRREARGATSTKMTGRMFSAALSGRNFFCSRVQPLRGWLISGRRFATIGVMLVMGVGAEAQTNELSDAEVQGRQLAREIYYAVPATNFDEKGTLIIRDRTGTITNIPIYIDNQIIAGRWTLIYNTVMTIQPDFLGPSTGLAIVHKINEDNKYLLSMIKGQIIYGGIHGPFERGAAFYPLTNSQIMAPFAGSDFWICDLGLEFLHWPDQKIIKKEFMRGRGCMVLESTNPNPTPNGYLRVDSWIDEETLGVVHAEAYDANEKLLKVFDPKSFKKVNGQWELQDMEIRNVQTGSRTRIEFDFGK
jgi:hypothetical protein